MRRCAGPRAGNLQSVASSVAVALAGLAAVVALNVAARRVGLPAAVLLVLGGLLYAVLPGPNLTLQPSVVLDVVIPPLLYAAAVNSSAIGLRRNARAVLSLSVGLVLATALVVGAVLHAAVPTIPMSLAVALGAAIAPPDPVAALAIGRPAGLSPRLITVVEGEGLLNDATALTLFELAVAAAVGGSFSLSDAIGHFALAAIGGVAAGLASAVVIAWLRRHVTDSLSDNALSIATPFAAYLLAHSFGGSGVLAVVIAGLWFAHRGPAIGRGDSRLQARPVWGLIEYLLEGFVFLLIGQQFPSVIRNLPTYSSGTIALASTATVVVMLILRPLWLVASELLPARLHTRLGAESGKSHEHLSVRDVLALSWSGTRGVITLAAAFSLPLRLENGTALPGRDLLLFCAYLAVLVTLVGQGLTFAPLLHGLGFRDSGSGEALLRNQARAAAVRAALTHLDELSARDEVPDDIVAPLKRSASLRLDRYARRAEQLSSAEDATTNGDDSYLVGARVRRSMIAAERDELLQWRDTGRLSDRSLRILQRELDHEEGLLPPG